MKQTRREFVSTLTMAGAAIPLISHLPAEEDKKSGQNYPVRLFSKPLDSYEFDFMCECLVSSGIGGFDLTVRQGGKAEPTHVESVLPRLAEEAEKYGLKLDMMVTGILSASDPFTEKVLKTASGLGIKYYRLGWYDYDLKAGIRKSIQKCRNELREIAVLNQKYKISAGYQNHSGTRIGGPVWDINELLSGISPGYVGCQYDVRHATVEGANTWTLGMRLISDRINSLAIKDFTWKQINGKPEAVTVPLGEGIVDWDKYFGTIKELRIEGPVTLHVEYPLLENVEEGLPLIKQQDIIVRKLKKDMDFLNGYIDKYKLR
jgi:sugar phosphate isomerase/epimerase